MIQKQIKNLIKHSLKNLDIETGKITLEHPADMVNGDYSTNVALVSKIDPEKIVKEMKKNLPDSIERIEIRNRFINFYLSQKFFSEKVKEILNQKENWGKNSSLARKKVMVEYTQPNPFKPFHIGHLMSNSIGESISRIIEFSGARVVRANYQGDVGPHVAKAIYELKKNHISSEFELPNIDGDVMFKAQFIGECYAKGNFAYENNEQAKKEIDEINKKVYDKSDLNINKIYDWGRKITLDAFEEIYKVLGTKFDKYFFESQMVKIGTRIVKKNTPKLFENSEGAIVFKAEEYNTKLHTRVFITSQGLPTYEAKELGLTLNKFKKTIFSKKLDLSIVTTAVEQADYMNVVQKVISLIYPKLENRMKHITHGMMRLTSGKMSSRSGNVVTGESLIKDALIVIREKIAGKDFIQEEREKIARIVGVSALKYSILKSSIGSDIIFDFDKSISFDGDSGPYLQYTAVRANSIIEKAKKLKLVPRNYNLESNYNIVNLERILYKFPEIIQRSYEELETHYITMYLTELASAFNSFYGSVQILNENNKHIAYHVDLVKAFYQTMKNGLWVLGIETPERM